MHIVVWTQQYVGHGSGIKPIFSLALNKDGRPSQDEPASFSTELKAITWLMDLLKKNEAEDEEAKWVYMPPVKPLDPKKWVCNTNTEQQVIIINEQ